MSFEAIESIAKAEKEAQELVEKAQLTTREMVSKAEADGKNALLEAAAKAEKKISDLKVESEKAGVVKADKFALSVKEKAETLKASAEAKLDKAATLVVERIVNG